jgi:SAM-dependent methyltransferase
MWNDADFLREFYESGLGRTARTLIRDRLRQVWPNTMGQRVFGLGYATPFIKPFQEDAERVIAAMPATQGVLRWPNNSAGKVMLCDEGEIPLPDVSIDRIILAHALECSEQVRPMLREIWRILADDGRLIVVVPNRRGIWARFDSTPFGRGNPYTLWQLNGLLRDTLFAPSRTERALFMPPSQSGAVEASAGVWDQVGRRICPIFSGVILVEAGKLIHAATADRAAVQRRRRTYTAAAPGAHRLRD